LVRSAAGDEQVVVAILASQKTLNGCAAVIGRVVEAGVRAASLDGKTVLVGPHDPCGECDVCRRGGAAVCPLLMKRDALGDHVIASGRYCVPLGDGLELPVPEGAAVAGDVALAYTLYARTGVAPRDPVVVVGASPVARFLTEILIAKGCTPIVVADESQAAWCEWLRRKQVAIAADRDAMTAAIAAQGITGRAARVIAAAPHAAASAAVFTGPRSTLTVLAPVDGLPGELAAREVVVISVAGMHPDLVVEAAAMCMKGEIDLANGTARSENNEMRAVVQPR
jgi:D-arabinose 1-dehydrogenase-like Zn-dependent alcohol dehydrogenase